MQKALQEKLEKIVALVDNAMVDPDIDLEYCIPEVVTTTDSCEVSGDPYILVKYSEDKYITRKIKLTPKYLEQTPEQISNLVTFSIEQFKEELDSVHMG
jgi:hypothetical protein